MKIFLINFRKVVGSVLLNPALWIYWIGIFFLYGSGVSIIWVLLNVLIFVSVFNFLPYFLIKNQEFKFRNNIDNFQSDGLIHVLVLGGGHTPDSEILLEQQLNNTSLRRVVEGVRLFNLNSNSLLVMSGESLKKGHPSQAEIQAKVAITMGVDKNKIVVIPEPVNTEEEALYYYRNFGFHKNPIYLVTKAIHLRRAVFIFSLFGYNIIPSPAYFIYKNFKPAFSWFFAPDFQLILHFGEFMKEQVGFAVLKIQLALGLKSFPIDLYGRKEDFRRSSFEFLNR